MTEEIAAAPGWFEARLDEVLASLPQADSICAARDAYLDCIAKAKAPAAPSDMLGTEDEACHQTLLRALDASGVAAPGLGRRLEALEAELSEAS